MLTLDFHLGSSRQLSRVIMTEHSGRHSKGSAERRTQQDYVGLDSYISVDLWRAMLQGKTDRHRAEQLCAFLLEDLGLQLPSEPTYANMTAVVAAFRTEIPSQYELHETLQVVKSTWKSCKKNFQAKTVDKSPLLLKLPCEVSQLPAKEAERMAECQPATTAERPFSSQLIEKLTGLVPLRLTHDAVVQEKNKQKKTDPMDFLRALTLFLPERQTAPAEGKALLQNLKIFSSPQKGGASTVAVRDKEASLRESLGGPSKESTSARRDPYPLAIQDAAPKEAVDQVRPGRSDLPREDQEPAENAGDFSHLKSPATVAPCEGVCQRPAAGSAGRTQAQNFKGDRRGLQEDAAAFLRERQGSSHTTAAKKRPAACQSSSEPQARKKPCVKRPAAKNVATTTCAKEVPKKTNFPFKAKRWGTCKAEYYTEKSYIRSWCVETSKWKLVIGSQADRHQDIVSALVPHVRAGKTHEVLLQVRDDVAAKF